MKKTILSLAMLIIASCAFAQDAEFLMKQYKKIKGADYENITKKAKKDAKKQQYTNPKNYDLMRRVKKAHYVTVVLNDDEREALTKNIENIDGYKLLLHNKSNVDNILNDKFTLFPNRQYYGIEENGIVKDAIIRVDARMGGKITSIILHVTGSVTVDELMDIMGFEETNAYKQMKEHL